MSQQPVFVLCPGNVVTGGPELLHQLVDVLNDAGVRASIVYTPLEKRFEVPEAYRRYKTPQATKHDIQPGSRVVMSEVYWSFVNRFPGCEIMFWWLSVDIFHASKRSSRVSRYMPDWLFKAWAHRSLRKHVSMHLHQSHYAQSYLAANGLGPSASLSDYLATDYLDAIKHPPRVQRKDVVAFNPAKGRERTEIVLKHLMDRTGGSIRAVPIKNMSREEVKGLLTTAKVYIDFGHHPGKDRIPREAAALGCCVIVNRRGSAANAKDVPISNEYKIDDNSHDFADMAVHKIVTLCRDFESRRSDFDAYRSAILAEPDLFRKDALYVFDTHRRR